MTFNVNATTTDGDDFASDQVATVHHPLMKIEYDDGAGGAVKVATANPLPVTAASLPLPTGAATAANQTTANASLATIAGDTTSLDAKVTVCDTGAVVISSSALPTGAATAANQATEITHLATVAGAVKTDAAAKGTTGVQILGQDGTNARLIKTDAAGELQIDVLTMPTTTVTGTVTANAGTDLNTSALALEAGGNLATIAGDTTSLDAKVTVCNTGAVVVSSSALPTGAATAANQTAQQNLNGASASGRVAVPVMGYDALNFRIILTDTVGRQIMIPDTAHGGSDATGPFKIGGRAHASTPTPVLDTQRVNGYFDLTGHLHVKVDNATGASAVNIQDGGNSITIDATSLPLPTGAATETTLDAVKTAVETIDNAISGTEMQVDVVAALPAGTNAIGKLAANSGVDIGDVDVTSLPKAVQGPGNPNIDSYSTVAISASANTANQSLVGAPGLNKQIWVYGILLTADTGDGTVAIQDEDDTALTGAIALTQTGGFSINPSGNFAMPWIKVATNKALEIDTVTCGAKGVLTYAVVSV